MRLADVVSEGKMPGAVVVVAPSVFRVSPIIYTILLGHKWCGICKLCKRLSYSSHPDFVVSEGDTVDEARRLVNLAHSFPSQESVRLFCIHGSRSHDFQNVMLKLLEEPGPRNRIVWVVNDRSLLLPTVLSRCYICNEPIRSSIPFDSEARQHANDIWTLVQDKDFIKLQIITEHIERPVAVMRELQQVLFEAKAPVPFMTLTSALIILSSRGRPLVNAIHAMAQMYVDGVR